MQNKIRFLILGEARSVVSHIEKCGGTVVANLSSQQSRQINDKDFLLPRADVLLNCFSPHILKSHILQQFGGNSYNVHNGKLPEYAGIHVHQWAIRNGESSTAVTIHNMCNSVDAGDIFLEKEVHITNDETGLSLFQKTKQEGLALMQKFVEKLINGESFNKRPQDLQRRTVYTHKSALDASINWSLPAQKVRDFIRAGSYYPFKSPTYTATLPSSVYGDMKIVASDVVDGHAEPGTLIGIENGMPIIACGSGAVRLSKVLTDANSRIDWSKFLNQKIY